MMKKIYLFLLILLLGGECLADTCPKAEDISYYTPPVGWTFLISPDYLRSRSDYPFSSAIHSLNYEFYFKQVICRYGYDSFLAPAFTLVSDKTYEQPSERTPPWDHRSVIRNVITCMPGDRDPAHCIFE